MNKEESIQQIETLIEAWKLDEADLNQRDINAMQSLLKENQELKEKLDKYENPEDMTLFAMWCTEKVKEENERLKKKYENAVADLKKIYLKDNKVKLFLTEDDKKKFTSDYIDNHNVKR